MAYPCRRSIAARRRGRRWGDDAGKAAVEFAMIAPAFVALLCALFEFSGILFVQNLLEAGAREAARFGITGQNSGGTREQVIRQIVGQYTLGAIDVDHIAIDTLVYDTFDSIGKPEPYDDANGNGLYDAGESYSDLNGNGTWDADMGEAGLGGPGDIVLYRLTYAWGVLVPLLEPFLGETVALVASVAVRNEPFPD